MKNDKEAVNGVWPPVRWLQSPVFAKRFVFTLLMIVFGFAGGAAHATCSFKSGTFTNVVLTLPALISAPRNSPVGTILYDSGWTGSTSASINCTGGEALMIGYASGLTPVSGTSYVYATGVPGIGVKAAYSNTLSAGYHPANIDSVDNYGAWLLDWRRVSTLTARSGPYSRDGAFAVRQLYDGDSEPDCHDPVWVAADQRGEFYQHDGQHSEPRLPGYQ